MTPICSLHNGVSALARGGPIQRLPILRRRSRPDSGVLHWFIAPHMRGGPHRPLQGRIKVKVIPAILASPSRVSIGKGYFEPKCHSSWCWWQPVCQFLILAGALALNPLGSPRTCPERGRW